MLSPIYGNGRSLVETKASGMSRMGAVTGAAPSSIPSCFPNSPEPAGFPRGDAQLGRTVSPYVGGQVFTSRMSGQLLGKVRKCNQRLT